MIALHNHSDLEQTIEPAERVAQLVITPFITADSILLILSTRQ